MATGISRQLAKRATGFFDLPLELRRMIYKGYLASESWCLQLNTGGMDSIFECHPQIAQEMFEEAGARCSCIQFHVTTTKWKAVPPITACKSADIDIEIEIQPYMYEQEPMKHTRRAARRGTPCTCDICPGIHRRRREQILTMRENLKTFIRWIKDSGFKIPYVLVEFSKGFVRRDKANLQAWFGYHTALIPITMNHKVGSQNIMACLLEPMVDFPKVDEAMVLADSDCKTDWFFFDKDLEAEFVCDYEMVLVDAWERWLQSSREKSVYQHMVDVCRKQPILAQGFLRGVLRRTEALPAGFANNVGVQDVLQSCAFKQRREASTPAAKHQERPTTSLRLA